MISIDFETRSETNLLTDGMYNYASCPSTEIICMAYAIDDEEPKLWHRGEPIPEALRYINKNMEFYAWNADFERLIWDFIMVPDHGFPPIELEQWRCTMFMARTNNMPGALGNAARCLNVEQQKSNRGRELIKLLCIPIRCRFNKPHFSPPFGFHYPTKVSQKPAKNRLIKTACPNLITSPMLVRRIKRHIIRWRNMITYRF